MEKHNQHHYQQQQKRHFPRISSWTSSLSSFAHHPRAQQQEFITPSQSGVAPHQHQSNTAKVAAHNQKSQHHTCKLLIHRGFTNAKNTWCTSICRRNTVTPEKPKNKGLVLKKKLNSLYKNSSIIEDHHHRSNDITSTQSTLPSSPSAARHSSSHSTFVIKSWICRHSFDRGSEESKHHSDSVDHIFTHEHLQQQFNKSVVSSDTNTKERSTTTSNGQYSSRSLSSRSSFTSSSTTSTAITNTTHSDIAVTFTKYSCTTATTTKDLVFTPMLLKTNKKQLLSTKIPGKISIRLYDDDVLILQAICCIWTSAILLLQAVMYITLISWNQQQQKQQQIAHDHHHDITSLAFPSSLFPLHCHSEHHVKIKQLKNCRSSVDIDNRGNGNTGATRNSTYDSWHKKQVVCPKLRTALASLVSSSDVTPTIPTCWPPLTESRIITDAIRSMRPYMKHLWAEHNTSMMLYKQQIPVRPTERRNWMRQERRKNMNNLDSSKHCNDDKKEECSSSKDKQIVMNLARETLEYFEQWYGNYHDRPTGCDQQEDMEKNNSTQIKAIHWLRQITSTAAAVA
ncbi:hypothetical protein INT45_001769 [Circinella minor]|uniref:Uncharacterized protein n=1 Tax=Circinella minor TaxID=1195481 RepID=A0A8H7RUQ3_9FUNG|nr:hypothetical protein INT45_001769 [Circinella minor]